MIASIKSRAASFSPTSASTKAGICWAHIGIANLIARADAMIPGMARRPLLKTWSGLRPATPDRLPYIGKSPMEGLLVATGHFRNGILLAPITAELVAEILTGRPPSVALEPFDPARAPVPSS